jgi:hypothetical protein
MLYLNYILGLKTFGAFRDAEFDRIPLVQGLEAGGLDCGVMNEDIIPGCAADESISFFVVKPLYCSLFCHSSFSVIDVAPAGQEYIWIAYILLIGAGSGDPHGRRQSHSRVCGWRW